MAVNSYHEWIKLTRTTHGCKPKDFLKAFKVLILPFIVTKQQQPAMWRKSQFIAWAKTLGNAGPHAVVSGSHEYISTLFHSYF